MIIDSLRLPVAKSRNCLSFIVSQNPLFVNRKTGFSPWKYVILRDTGRICAFEYTCMDGEAPCFPNEKRLPEVTVAFTPEYTGGDIYFKDTLKTNLKSTFP